MTGKQKIFFPFVEVELFPDCLHLNEPVSQDVTAESAWKVERTKPDL